MPAGVGQVIVGVAFATSITTVLVAVVKFAVSVGVKVTDSDCARPADSTILAAGVYANVPGVLAVAFRCAELSAVPYVSAAGFAQVTTGVALATSMATVFVAVV